MPVTPDRPSSSILLLGRDHPDFGRHHMAPAAGDRTVCAISAGSDPFSPSMRSKGQPDEPNEDAVLARDEGDRMLLAVADAHFGLEASHELLVGLHDLDRIPADPADLEEGLVQVALRSKGRGPSATTLVAAVLDRRRGAGFGISFGDSSLFLVGEGGARPINTRTADFVRPWESTNLEIGQGLPFRFRTGTGQLLVGFTDGVDECHYRSPKTSVRPRHLERLFDHTGPDAGLYARELMQLALEGVDGNPGGQDNVALVVSQVNAA